MGSSNQALLIGGSTATGWTAGDPHWSTCVLSMHCEGGGGSSTFVDSSSYNHTLTPGTATEPYHDNTEKKFGSTSASYQAGGVLRSADALPEFQLVGDFTIAFWVTGEPSFQSFHLELTPIDGGFDPLWIDCASNLLRAKMRFAVISGAVNFPVVGIWHHIAYRRSGTTVTLWVDGVQIASGTNNWTHVSAQFALSGNGFFIDELQLWNGVAKDIPEEYARTEPHPDFGGNPPPPATNKAVGTTGSRATFVPGLASLAVTANTVNLLGNLIRTTAGVPLLPGDKVFKLQGSRAVVAFRPGSAVPFGPAAFVHDDGNNPQGRQRIDVTTILEAYPYLDSEAVLRYFPFPKYAAVYFWLDGKTTLVVESYTAKVPSYVITFLDDWLTADTLRQLYAEGNYTIEQLAPKFDGNVVFTVPGYPWSLSGNAGNARGFLVPPFARAGIPVVGRGIINLTPGLSPATLFIRMTVVISLEILRTSLPSDVAGLFPSSAVYLLDFKFNLSVVNT